MKTKIHKITLLVVDHDGLSADQVREVLEGTRYPNHCIAPRVMGSKTREVEWSDEHPLNSRDTQAAELKAMFDIDGYAQNLTCPDCGAAPYVPCACEYEP